MDDKQIVDLYWSRSENAIKETEVKYGKYCRKIAMNILSNELDAEECVNDTYLKAWDAMPPHRPERLSTFLGKITRNLSLNRYAHDRAQKRAPGIEVIYGELADIIPEETEEEPDSEELARAINGFLATLSPKHRIIFVKRYWYLCSIKEIAKSRALSESDVKVSLMRSRRKFKEYLTKEGITV